MDYIEVEKTSYELYLSQDWEELVAFGKQAEEAGITYFYFNLRMGIAFFKLKEYKKSKDYLTKANQENSFNKVVIEYLFWDNYYLLKEKESALWYAKLDDTIQQRINYIPPKTLESIFIEGGQKISTDRNVADKIDYFNFGITLNLGARLKIDQGYTFLQQNLNWGNLKQHQYYINPKIRFKKSMEFNLGFHFANFKSSIDYYIEGVYQSSTPQGGFPFGNVIDSTVSSKYQIEGTYGQNDFLFQPRFTKTWKAIKVSPYLSYVSSIQGADYFERYTDTTTITERTGSTIINQSVEYSDSIILPENQTISQFGVGANLFYIFKFITVGGQLEYINRDNNSFFFVSPYLKLDLGKKTHLSAYYFSKKNYTVGLFEASQLINSSDSVDKLSFTAQYDAFKKLSLFLTYQYETIESIMGTGDYRLNSVYLSLKFKF